MIRILLLAACSAFFARAAQATTQDDVLSAGILNGWEMPNGHHMAALQLTLAPGWKTYWRAPGDAGIPPLFDWSGSTNVAAVTIHWPSPTVFNINGMQSIGYHDQLTLPLEVTPVDASKPIELHAQVDMGVCKDICMPAMVKLQAGLASPGALDPSIREALKEVPLTAQQAGLKGIACTFEAIDDGLRLTARISLPSRGSAETVAFETNDKAVWVAEAQTSRSGNILTSVTDLVPSNGAPFALDRSAVTVTVLGEGRAVEIAGCPAP